MAGLRNNWMSMTWPILWLIGYGGMIFIFSKELPGNAEEIEETTSTLTEGQQVDEE